MASTATDAPTLYRASAYRRRELVRPFVGQLVVVTVDLHRDGTNLKTVSGLLLAIAAPRFGGAQSDQLIVRSADRLECVALSIASVREVRT